MRQKEIENVQFEGKKSTRKLNIAARVCAAGNKVTEERPNLRWNKGSGASGQEPPGRFPVYEQKRPEEFSALERNKNKSDSR